jgi:hypothetical protein
MKTAISLVIAFISLTGFSQTPTNYKHGVDGIVFWVDTTDVQKYIIVSEYGAKFLTREEVADVVYDRFLEGQTTGQINIATKHAKIIGYMSCIDTENAILIDFVYYKILWNDGRVEIYDPPEPRLN